MGIVKRNVVIIFLLQFLAGAYVWQFGVEVYAFLVCFCVITGMLTWFITKKKYVFWIVFLLVLSSVCVIFVGKISNHTSHIQTVDYFNDLGKKVKITGVVTQEVDVRFEKVKYTLSVESIEFPTEVMKVSGNVLVNADRYPVYKYGDTLEVYGELVSPGEFNGFSYRNYLSRFHIYSVMYYAKVDQISSGNAWWFFEKMFDIKILFESTLSQIYDEPYASFMAGLLTGSRRGIAEDLMNKFNTTGLTHIIAISGFNISIIIVIIMSLFSFLPRKLSFYLAIISIVVFVLFVGSSAAVVRAGIMGVLGLIALHSGRNSHVAITILFSASIMVAWNPAILWYDLGFQLSFLAVLGLVYVAPHIEKFFQVFPESFGIREALLMTIAAQITSLPLIVFHFERLSVVSPLSNLLVAPFIPLAMIFGFLSVVFYWIFKPLGLIFGYFGYKVLDIVIWLVEITSRVPYASVDIVGLSVFWVVLYYVLLFTTLMYLHKKNAKADP